MVLWGGVRVGRCTIYYTRHRVASESALVRETTWVYTYR